MENMSRFVSQGKVVKEKILNRNNHFMICSFSHIFDSFQSSSPFLKLFLEISDKVISILFENDLTPRHASDFGGKKKVYLCMCVSGCISHTHTLSH